MIMALLLDLANILGGFLLALPLLGQAPRLGARFTGPGAWLTRFRVAVGVVALVAGGYYLLVHAVSGPRVFHFEIVGIGVGAALLWDRLTGRSTTEPRHTDPAGPGLLLAVFGLIAIVVGVQGLFTPDG